MMMPGKQPAVVKRYDFCGLPIAVENPAGTIRSWDAGGGKTGYTRMLLDYGFIEGYLSGDGEELDCYIGPHALAKLVHVVHQLKAPEYRAHDEDKVMLGFHSADEALAAYLAHRSDGDRAFGTLTTWPLDRFRAKLRRRGADSTSKIHASVALVERSLIALAGKRPSAGRRGGKPGARVRYEQRLIDRAIKLGAGALARDVRSVAAELAAGESYDDIKKRLARCHRGMDPAKLGDLLRRTAILARLQGMDAGRGEAGLVSRRALSSFVGAPAEALGGPGPGMIPVKKTITQKGKTFETTYWVKDPDAKKGKDKAAPAPKPAPVGNEPLPGNKAEHFPDPSELTFVSGAGHLGGAGSKSIYKDDQGNEWLWKPALSKDGAQTPKPYSAHAQEAYSTIVSQIKTTAAVKAVTIDGKVGTIQKMMKLDPDHPTVGKSTPPAKLTAHEKEDIGAEHVSDWLMSQHDSHGDNFVRTAAGDLVGVDKEQAFRYFGKDQLSENYHPNKSYGEAEPYYNRFWRDFAAGKNDFDPQVLGKYIERAQRIPDTEFSRSLESYARSLFSKHTDQQGFLSRAVARKADLRRDFEAFITRLGGEPFKFE